MLTHRGFSACIISEGKPIPEYLAAVVGENPKTISCWIPSEAGKTFTVYWRDEGTKMHSCAFITLDGFVVPGRFLFGEGETWRNGVRSGPHTERPFMFAQRSSSGASEQSMKDAGSIMLKIRLVTLDGSKAANPLQNIPDLNSQSHLGDHCIGYGQEMNTYKQSPITWKVKASDQGSNRSHVTFLFRYRSPEWLMAQGIMPTELHVPKNHPAKRRVASAPVAHSVNAPITPSPSASNSKKAEPYERLVSIAVSSYHPIHVFVYHVECRTKEYLISRTRSNEACTQCQDRERRGPSSAQQICRGNATRLSS
ncbi:uncharacterized protein F5891DRAFT_1006850 [Suillus fuscotomentosus]|uniref:DUF7918 domain-containing protein n=1 Tax=Suillus fuscotomentosus TaxID=1912939 RepID=A0AAD4HR22_9AGAM|nr:uncharacterized protein F5891DRAFT_1006850 [Suillus fuscotomentosus]KAG1905848.1 hypothetical protein F5891DRAFT_1006850 [Suillus fuscotomentosus]